MNIWLTNSVLLEREIVELLASITSLTFDYNLKTKLGVGSRHTVTSLFAIGSIFLGAFQYNGIGS